ncbi:MAG: guanylate kinase [bacterium]
MRANRIMKTAPTPHRETSHGTIFIISAPSGTGKTTLIDRIKASLPDLYFPVTMTTRPMRPGESNAVDYYFVDRADFRRHVAADELVEWATVYGNLYGVPRWELEKPISEGRDVLFDIDTQGRETLVARYAHSVSIFIAPPNLAALEERLRRRGLNDERDLTRRLAEAEIEMKRADRYDYIIVNDSLDDAFEELKTILLTERARRRGRVERE